MGHGLSIRVRIWLGAMACAILLVAAFAGLAGALGGWGAAAPSGAAGVPWSLAVSALAVLLLFAPLAWLLAGLAYAPVRDVTKTARNIMSTGQLDRRCFYPGPRDDVGELVVSVNGLLVCYDLAIGRIRRLRTGEPSCACPRPDPGFDPSDYVIDLETHHEGARSI